MFVKVSIRLETSRVVKNMHFLININYFLLPLTSLNKIERYLEKGL